MKIDYNMTKDYRSHWSELDAIREMVQNAADTDSYKCSVSGDVIAIVNTGVIAVETLMLGESQKSSDSVGRYGEGYKIAMMILTRAGMNPEIISGGKIFTGSFETNSLGMSSFVLTVADTADDYLEDGKTHFSCAKGNIDTEELYKRFPAFVKPLSKPNTVDILMDKPGQLYVNGLWICEAKLTHGYNFHPEYVELNTDRNMVRGVNWELGRMYGSKDETWAEHIFNLIENDADDVSELYYHLHSSELKTELVRLFYNKYGEGAKLGRPGTSYIGSSSYVATSSHASRIYSWCGIAEAKREVDPEAPYAVLESFLKANKSKLRRDVRISFSSIIERSKGWRKPDCF